ncbi:molybdate ABC transporter substrate-binding protein [Virgibacillus salexigens]|uniref:molybdate ABC transporter substrate-binding protein n=1 Tax=Virgibacillus massiliensis TaxID=1462526 RepID=UPI00136EBC4B|nr:molybdate ABC transporter substrate-binding protein [Virgibacillus massiliensis]MYL41332.1 molybdate ABC transporter substrate-binding protein [Virgibacillus massiliensis]
MKHLILLLVALLSLTGCAMFEQEEPFQESTEENRILVSADASLTDVLPKIISAFEASHPYITVDVNYGGSGKLSQQIQQGAPVDLFLSSNQEWMNVLEEEDVIVKESRSNFIGNKLVIISNKESSLSLPTIHSLLDTSVSSIAVGDPITVPSGTYAKEALQSQGVWDQIENKLVYTNDVRQALQYVETGKSNVGVVYASDAASSKQINVLTEINKNLHTPIVYPAGVTSYSTNRHDAESFIDFLNTEEATEIFESYQFININNRK